MAKDTGAKTETNMCVWRAPAVTSTCGNTHASRSRGSARRRTNTYVETCSQETRVLRHIRLETNAGIEIRKMQRPVQTHEGTSWVAEAPPALMHSQETRPPQSLSLRQLRPQQSQIETHPRSRKASTDLQDPTLSQRPLPCPQASRQ